MDPRRRGDDDGVYNIYFFMHRHTGAGRYPLFHVFLKWIPAVAGMTTFFKFYLFKHRHTGAVFYFYGPYSRLRGNDKFFILYLSSTVIPAQAGIHCFMYSLFIGLPRLRRAMTGVCNGQVQEATRTQWIPAVAGMTTVAPTTNTNHLQLKIAQMGDFLTDSSN